MRCFCRSGEGKWLRWLIILMNQFQKYHQAFINNVYIEALSSLNTSCVSVQEEQRANHNHRLLSAHPLPHPGPLTGSDNRPSFIKWYSVPLVFHQRATASPGPLPCLLEKRSSFSIRHIKSSISIYQTIKILVKAGEWSGNWWWEVIHRLFLNSRDRKSLGPKDNSRTIINIPM